MLRRLSNAHRMSMVRKRVPGWRGRARRQSLRPLDRRPPRGQTAEHERPRSVTGPGCVKTRSDLVVMPCGARIFALICPPCAHTPQKSWCAFTAQSFHTAWANSRRFFASASRPLIPSDLAWRTAVLGTTATANHSPEPWRRRMQE